MLLLAGSPPIDGAEFQNHIHPSLVTCRAALPSRELWGGIASAGPVLPGAQLMFLELSYSHFLMHHDKPGCPGCRRPDTYPAHPISPHLTPPFALCWPQVNAGFHNPSSPYLCPV